MSEIKIDLTLKKSNFLFLLCFKIAFIKHRYLGSVIFAFKTTLTATLNHITCINTFGEGFKKTLFAINAIFTKDNNLSKTKVGGLCRKQSLQPRNVKQT